MSAMGELDRRRSIRRALTIIASRRSSRSSRGIGRGRGMRVFARGRQVVDVGGRAGREVPVAGVVLRADRKVDARQVVRVVGRRMGSGRRGRGFRGAERILQYIEMTPFGS